MENTAHGRMTLRLVITAVLTSVIFFYLGWLYPPNLMTDVPTRHGAPFVFSESGCYMIAKDDGSPNCISRFRLDLLFADLFGVAIPMYGIAILVTRNKRM